MTCHQYNRNRIASVLALSLSLTAAVRAAVDEHGHDHEDAKAPATQAEHAHDEQAPVVMKEDAPGLHDEHDHAKADPHGAHDGHAKADADVGHGDEVKLAPEAMRVNRIRVEPAGKHVLTPVFIAPARVSFNLEQMAHVGSAVAGRVSELKVRLGDVVKKGDVLLVVDSPELGEAQSDFLMKRMAVSTAEPAVELAKSAYERAKQLLEETQGIALSDVQKREAEYKAAQGAMLGAKAAATAAENKLHLLGLDQAAVESLVTTGEIHPKHAVRAPIDGQVVEREATLGELVSPDREALLILADMSTLWVLADIPEARLGQVSVGSTARIRIAADANAPIDGTVSYMAPQVDSSTRTAKVRIEVRNGHTPLKPGMFAQVQISAPAEKEQEAVLAVPEEAIQSVEGAPSVFVAVPNEENTFARRPVKPGQAVGGMVPIVDGLTEGEHLVVSGSFILKAELGKSSAVHEH